MIPTRVLLPLSLAAALVVLSANPLAAQRGNWGGPGWGGGGWRSDGPNHRSAARADSNEGRVSADHFVAQGAAAALAHGTIAIATAPATMAEPLEQDIYAAAMIDRLAHAGYDTVTLDHTGGQVVELTVLHAELIPPEPSHRPVSGSVSVETGNRGSGIGLALAYDATKPLGALISTRIEARIRDRISHALLWEGHAEMATREGDSRWNSQKIAAQLAGALLAHFPAGGPV